MEQHQKTFLEVVHTEKQLMTLIQSKCILSWDFLELYRKIRTRYEKILLTNEKLVELQEVEYHLWKLHYKLIGEFRKSLRQHSTKAEIMENETLSENITSERYIDEFKSFLSEATGFYGDLIVKLQKTSGLPSEIFLNNKFSGSFSIEPMKLDACQYTCHRLLICLGDLARYIEVAKKPEARKWSTAANHYIEATKIWPDSGNPHNQLALLATYVGDDFLALYHCVRSLAVKEPFPDAWSNLMLVLEELTSREFCATFETGEGLIKISNIYKRNSSTLFGSNSSEMQFDFLNPSKRIISFHINSSPKENCSSKIDKLEGVQNVCPESIELWPTLVRTLSFLLIGSSLEEFPRALAISLQSLEALLSVDDAKLTAAMESYNYMDPSKRGPYRAIQLVSIIMFVTHTLINNPKKDKPRERHDHQTSSTTPLTFVSMFIFIGRLTERCMTGSRDIICPLLPAVLVSLEWLVGVLDIAEAHDADERVTNAKSYFFRALVDLLDRLGENGKVIIQGSAALWEDHELRGFYPLTHVHETLDFTTHLDCIENFDCQNECRLKRIFQAATRIFDESKSLPYNKVGSVSNFEMQDSGVETDISLRSDKKTEPTTTEEDEVIVFKPITRRNSAPLYISKVTTDQVSPAETEIQGKIHDERLRRATSLSIDQNPVEIDSFSFCPVTSSSGLNQAGPPSLNAWVLAQNIESEKRLKDLDKLKLSPIEEMASEPVSRLSILENNFPEALIDYLSTTSYVAPIPSAPSLPDDAIWLSGNSLFIPENKNAVSNLGAAPTNGCINRSTFGLTPVSVPYIGMSSSEWLYYYRNNQINGFGNFYSNENTSYDLCDQWGNRVISSPMVYLGSPQVYPNCSVVYGEEQKRDRVFLDYQRPFGYVCSVGMELGSAQLPMRQYLKEEWQLQHGSRIRDPAFRRE